MPDATSPIGSARFGTQDLHVHTTMSDGDVSLAGVIEIASGRGIQIGIADHVSSRNRARFVSDSERLEAYLQALEAAPVFRSAELCWCDPFSTNLPPEILERLDYLIGSNHGFALPDGQFASPWWTSLPEPWADRPHDLMEIMVLNLCDLVAKMPISIIAHSTLLPPALLAIESEVEAWWTPDREARFIEACVGSGVAIEISNRYRLPHGRFLLSAAQAGATFSFGSDGHQPDQIAVLDWAVAAAHEAGIGEKQIFVAESGMAARRA